MLVFLCCGLFASGSTAEIYKWIDSRGTVNYSERYPTDAPARVEQLGTPGKRRPSAQTDIDQPPPAAERVKIHPASGLYKIGGKINASPVEFLVDTGASLIVIAARAAERLHIDYQGANPTGIMSTVAGPVRAYPVVLASVSVGKIEIKNVEAAVVENTDHSPEILLGMSFLNRIEMIQKGGLLMLVKR